jgi:hypothetical protein
MVGRYANYYLMKIARLSGWLLFVLVLGYILTGFALCGKLGFSQLIDLETALALHKLFDWPLVAIFAVHSAVTIYFALRRWGWMHKSTPRRTSEQPTPAKPRATESRQPHAAKS